MFCESDAKCSGCDCICAHFRRALESQVKRCLPICYHIGLHRLPTAHPAHIGSGAELLLLFFDFATSGLYASYSSLTPLLVLECDTRKREDLLATE